MNRVPLIDRNATTSDRKSLLDSVHTAFGTTSNMFRAVANSPAMLESTRSGAASTKLGNFTYTPSPGGGRYLAFPEKWTQT